MNLSMLCFCLVAALCLLPQVSSPIALMMGIFYGIVLGNPYSQHTQKLASSLLKASVVGLGAGMNLLTVMRVGFSGIGYTSVGIFLTLLLGLLMGRWMGIGPRLACLLSGGTAICGGSTIAAMTSTIRAKPEETSISLAVVFTLNAVALFLFSWVGGLLGLSGEQFGHWAGMAIHDTSSVVGAALSYGHDSVGIATTVKLARALWIVPVAFIAGWVVVGRGKSEDGVKPSYPWFILGFLGLAALATWVPIELFQWVYWVSQRVLVLTLFLIGANLSRASLKQVGAWPLLHGAILWVLVSAGTLLAILQGWIV